MHGFLKKKKHKHSAHAKASEGTVCGACGYRRQATDLNPHWQCPNCKAAYNKVNATAEAPPPASVDKPGKKYYSPAELEERNLQFLRRREAEKIRNEKKKKVRMNTGLAGVYAGMLTFTSGAASACSAAASNPVVQVIGAVIAVGSLVYLVAKVFGG